MELSPGFSGILKLVRQSRDSLTQQLNETRTQKECVCFGANCGFHLKIEGFSRQECPFSDQIFWPDIRQTINIKKERNWLISIKVSRSGPVVSKSHEFLLNLAHFSGWRLCPIKKERFTHIEAKVCYTM
jgi:hypothetical protein